MFLGQKKIIKFLEHELNVSQSIQSFLFWGEEHLGKKTLAVLFAKGSLCLKEIKILGGCGECLSCRRLVNNLNPDFLLVERQPEEESLKIENSRQIIDFLLFKPQISSKKVLIIDEAERLTEDAQNALLKILEEPPLASIIILVSHTPFRLLETIRSRLLSLRFSRVTNLELTFFLQEQFTSNEEERMKLIVEEAEGKPGLALNLLRTEIWEEKKRYQKMLAEIMKTDFNKCSTILGEICYHKEDLKSALQWWLKLLRQDLLTSKEMLAEDKLNLLKNIHRSFLLLERFNLSPQLLLEDIFLSNYFAAK